MGLDIIFLGTWVPFDTDAGDDGRQLLACLVDLGEPAEIAALVDLMALEHRGLLDRGGLGVVSMVLALAPHEHAFERGYLFAWQSLRLRDR